MSRIQQILEKAERDGAVRHLRDVTEHVAGSAGGHATPPLAPIGVEPPLTAPPVASVSGHVVSGVQLDPRLVAAAPASSVAAEQYRALRTRILHADAGPAITTLLVTSPSRDEGKTLTAANLGLTMAQDYQRRTCVVDANLRHPQLHRVFGLTDGPGLSDLLVGRATLDQVLVELEEHHTWILPAGTAAAHPAELLGTAAMRRTLEALRTSFDRVVIDAPAAVPLADVGIVTPLVDAVLLVVRAGRTSTPAIHDAIAAIDEGKLLGIVLNETQG